MVTYRARKALIVEDEDHTFCQDKLTRPGLSEQLLGRTWSKTPGSSTSTLCDVVGQVRGYCVAILTTKTAPT